MEYGELLKKNTDNLSDREICIVTAERVKFVQASVDELRKDWKGMRQEHQEAVTRMTELLSEHQHDIDGNSGRISKLCDRWKILVGIIVIVASLACTGIAIPFTSCAPIP